MAMPIMVRLCLNCSTRSLSKTTVSGGLVIMAKFLSSLKMMRYYIMAKSLLS